MVRRRDRFASLCALRALCEKPSREGLTDAVLCPSAVLRALCVKRKDRYPSSPASLPFQFLPQLEEALVSRDAHVASLDGLADRAVGFDFVAAVGEAAFVEVGAQLG